MTALDYDSPLEPYEVRVKCVELGRPAAAVCEADLRVAQSYHHLTMQLKMQEEERRRKEKEEEERQERERQERRAAGRRRERAEYLQYSRATLRELAARDTKDSPPLRSVFWVWSRHSLIKIRLLIG